MSNTSRLTNAVQQQYDDSVEGVMEDNKEAFVNRLNDYLDFYQLFDSFMDELRAAVPFDSIEYEDQATDTRLKNGYPGKHVCEYSLTHKKMSLGQIRVSRESQWQDSELEMIELMLAGLSIPLKNALSYQRDIRSAQRDELTGLRNGSYYRDIVDIEIERAQRYKSPFSLLIFDLDDFESINCRYSRHAGDAILQEVARRIEVKARGSDVVYRNGGDEFLIFLPNTEKNEARLVAHRIKDFVVEQSISYGEDDIDITLSAGVVTVTHEDTVDDLFDRANKAVMHAKVLGKDQVYSYHLVENRNIDRPNVNAAETFPE